jgi:hypothetical protein
MPEIQTTWMVWIPVGTNSFVGTLPIGLQFLPL